MRQRDDSLTLDIQPEASEDNKWAPQMKWAG
jgi:hypothetical protein